MKEARVRLVVKSILVVALLLSVLLVALVGCTKDEPVVNENGEPEKYVPVAAEDDILTEGTYQMTGMRDKIPMKAENFGDTLIVEKKGGTYYVTIEVVNNTKCERMYWSGRKDSMETDALITKDGLKTTYMFAFDDDRVQKKLDLQIGGGKMPLDPPFGFRIDFDKLEKVSDTVADGPRPDVFLPPLKK